MIRANCRNQFIVEDFNFVVDTLAHDSSNKIALEELLTDEETRDQVLDDGALFERVAASTGFAKISPYFYFYVLARHVFMDSDIDDRDLTDYVACLLAEFSCVQRSTTISHFHEKAYHYFTDMLQDSLGARPPEDFLIRSHMGNYALFMTGIFPDYVFRKSTYGRRAPGFDYYEKMGSSSFHWAARHRMATKLSLEEILTTLSQRFRQVRIALNDLKDKFIVVDEQRDGLDKMLRQIFYGQSGSQSLDS